MTSLRYNQTVQWSNVVSGNRRRRRDNHIDNISSSYPDKGTVEIGPLKPGSYKVQTSGENAMGEGEKSDPSSTNVHWKGLPGVVDREKEKEIKEGEEKPFYKELWFMILLILLLLLILLVLIIYCCCNRRGGGEYAGRSSIFMHHE